MITSAQAVDMLMGLILQSPLATSLSKIEGYVYAFQRPLNSTQEDIVVNAATLDRGAVQNGLLNVNIYVPNEVYTNGTEEDNTRPNIERLTELMTLASNFLSDIWRNKGTVNFELQDERILPDPYSKQHYANFRVIFRALNIK